MKCKRLAIIWVALLALLLSTGSVIGQEPNSQAEAQSQGDMSLTASVSSGISYQGVLQEDGVPVSGSRDMVFGLFSNDTCTTQVGDDIVRNGVLVSDGLFSVELDVDHDDFDGQGLWLEVEVGGTAIGCQEILPAPYALSLRPGAMIAESTNRVELNRHYQQTFPYAEYHAAVYAEADPVFSPLYNYYYGIHALGQHIGVLGESNTSSGKGVFGRATSTSGTNYGIYGSSDSHDGVGVYGTASVIGVEGYASDPNGATHGVHGVSDSPDGVGVYGAAPVMGVEGHATYTDGTSYGVYGSSDSSSGRGVYGATTATSGTTYGVYGRSDSTTGGYGGYFKGYHGVWAIGTDGYGVHSETDSSTDHRAAISGSAMADNGITYGVKGRTASDTEGAAGVFGFAADLYGATYGVYGLSDSTSGRGVFGHARASSGTTYGVYGLSDSSIGYGVYAENTAAGGVGLYAVGGEGAYAAVFEGKARTQVLHITGGSDLAEPFEIAGAGSLVPGLVVAIDPEHPGQLRVADRAYDRTVAGCISGANGLNPGLTLEQEGLADGGLPVALSGRVYCWADASYGSIQPGDLLTSSDTPGHAMRVSAYERAQGAIIGKAMSSLEEGRGLILVLVTLQ